MGILFIRAMRVVFLLFNCPYSPSFFVSLYMNLMLTSGRYVNVEMRKFIIVISFVIFYSFTGYAFFEKDIRVLTMQNGLADNTVSCIHKDRDGFMWFGTDNGLSRYDGKNIKNFGSDSLYMKVFHISETENGLLWLIAN